MTNYVYLKCEHKDYGEHRFRLSKNSSDVLSEVVFLACLSNDTLMCLDKNNMQIIYKIYGWKIYWYSDEGYSDLIKINNYTYYGKD